jgi:chromosome segregation ATPase
MSDDLVKRLRAEELRLGRASFDSADAGLSCNLAMEAADEIERLRAELTAERERADKNRDLSLSACIELSRAREELATTEKERDEYRKVNWSIHDQLNALRAELAALRKEHEAMKTGFEVASEILGDDIAKLCEALEPFAAQATDRDDYTSGRVEITVAMPDLRRARAVLKETKGDGDA